MEIMSTVILTIVSIANMSDLLKHSKIQTNYLYIFDDAAAKEILLALNRIFFSKFTYPYLFC